MAAREKEGKEEGKEGWCFARGVGCGSGIYRCAGAAGRGWQEGRRGWGMDGVGGIGGVWGVWFVGYVFPIVSFFFNARRRKNEFEERMERRGGEEQKGGKLENVTEM